MSLPRPLVLGRTNILISVIVLVTLFFITSFAVRVTSTVTLAVTKGAYLDGKVFMRIGIVGVKMCATICYRSTNCSSFNFNSKQLQCQLLLFDDSSPMTVSSPNFSYSTRDSWSGFGGPCEKDPCVEPYQICVERKEKRFCVKSECNSFPEKIVRHTSIQSTSSNTARSVGAIFTHVCNAGFRMSGPGEITCQPDLNFTSPDPSLTCYRCYDDWVLVARFTKGIGGSPRSIWQTTGKNSDNDTDVEDECFSTEASIACTHHYRSGLVDQWSDDILQVKVALYEKGDEKAYIVFDAAGSTSTNWFVPSRILESSWDDVTPSTNYVLFKMSGLSGPVDRSFLVSKVLDACHNDFGWLHIIEDNGFCLYDTLASYPYFMYSKTTTTGNQNSGFDMADVFAILVRKSNFP